MERFNPRRKSSDLRHRVCRLFAHGRGRWLLADGPRGNRPLPGGGLIKGSPENKTPARCHAGVAMSYHPPMVIQETCFRRRHATTPHPATAKASNA